MKRKGYMQLKGQEKVGHENDYTIRQPAKTITKKYHWFETVMDNCLVCGASE